MNGADEKDLEAERRKLEKKGVISPVHSPTQEEVKGVYNPATKRGSMVNNVSDEMLAKERAKLEKAGKIHKLEKDTVKSPLQEEVKGVYNPATKRGSMVNNVSDEMLAKERAKLEKAGKIHKLEDKSKKEETSNDDGETSPTNKTNRMIRGSMINGATAEDLEKEKAKLDRILKEQREKEEAENLVKKLAGSLSGVEKIEKQEKEDEELYRVKRPTKDRIEVQQKKPKGANSKACLIQ